MRNNFMLLTDAYKITHWNQYPQGTNTIYSYMEPRVGAKYEDIVWCGLQAILKEYNFDEKVVTQRKIEEAAEFCRRVFGHDYFNRKGWEYILDQYNGLLPVTISALPEGTIVKPGTPVMAIYNNDPKVPWLTNYIESLLMHCYAMTNTATISYACYKVIKKWCKVTGDEVGPFHLNDFGLRGAASLEGAQFCGIGHLLCFLGTDNLPAIQMAMDYYHSEVCGFSVIAAEHSTITSWGKANEQDAYLNILINAPYNATISLVIDSYNWQDAVRDLFCGSMKEKILARNGKTVLRPDSGVPHLVTREILEMLWDTYEGTVNDKGYRILDPHLGVIYGDGINEDSIDLILSEVVKAGFSPANVIFGMGGGLLQAHNRDTNRFAIKCSAIETNGTWANVKKDTPGKESKSGRFDLLPVYANGMILREETLVDMRKRVGILV